TSGASATNSAACLRMSAAVAQRMSIRRLRPSLQPNWRRGCSLLLPPPSGRYRLVALTPSRDLFVHAKDLFLEANDRQPLLAPPSSLLDEQKKHSDSYQQGKQNTDDERNNRMPSGLDLFRSSAFLRCSDAQPEEKLVHQILLSTSHQRRGGRSRRPVPSGQPHDNATLLACLSPQQ